jgi:hypothetical protein
VGCKHHPQARKQQICRPTAADGDALPRFGRLLMQCLTQGPGSDDGLAFVASDADTQAKSCDHALNVHSQQETHETAHRGGNSVSSSKHRPHCNLPPPRAPVPYKTRYCIQYKTTQAPGFPRDMLAVEHLVGSFLRPEAPHPHSRVAFTGSWTSYLFMSTQERRLT